MDTATPDPTRLASIAAEAMTCNACFEAGTLTRSYVDLPQPRYVGPGYAGSRPRIAWVMINPGAGQANQRDQSWRNALIAFRQGVTELGDVFAEQRQHMPHWNDLIPFIERHGLDVDNLAVVNVAWCASAGNKYPRAMLRQCWTRHTAAWLRSLAPEVAILSGSAAHAFESELADELPACRIIKAFHYAHRPLDADRAQARATEVRQELGL